MEQLELHIISIQSKLQELLKKYVALQKLSAKQQEIITTLTQQKEANENKIRVLEEQHYILKSAAGELTPSDKKAFEQTINKYIKEIDKCIALLSE